MGKGQRRNTGGTISAACARWLLAVGGLLLFGAVWAQTGPVGALDHVAGSVFVQTGGGELRRAEKGTPVANGDTVSTEAGAYANIRFVDGAEVFLRPNARVLIEAYVFEKDRAERDSFVYRLLKGSLRFITGQIGSRGKPEAYRLNTVVATIGIRGTIGDAELCAGDCPGKSDGLRTDAVEKPHDVSNPAGRAGVEPKDGSYTKDAQTPPEVVKGGNGLGNNDPPRAPEQPAETPAAQGAANHDAANAAYEQKIKTYLEKNPLKDRTARGEPTTTADETGKIVSARQEFGHHLVITHFIVFDANGNTQGYMLTPAGRGEQAVAALMKKYGVDPDDVRTKPGLGADENNNETMRSFTAVRRGGGVQRMFVLLNDKGEPYYWKIRDADGNLVVEADDPSRFPPLQNAPMMRVVTGICDHDECRRRAERHNAIAARMNGLALKLGAIDDQFKTMKREEQPGARQRHAAMFKEWQEMRGPLAGWETAVRECEELCRKNKGLVAVWNPTDIAACSVTAKAEDDMKAINKAAGGTLRTVTRLPGEVGGGVEGEIIVSVAKAEDACKRLASGAVTVIQTVIQEIPCGQMAPEAPGRKPTGPRARSVARNPIEMQVAQGKSFAQPVVIDRAANADGNVVNFLDGTGRPWRPQDARGPSVQTPTGGRFQIPASACPAGGGTLPLSQRITLGSFKTVDYDRIKDGVEYGQNAFDLLTHLEYLKYKQENGLAVEADDVRELLSGIDGLRGGKFEKLGGVLEGIEKGFERKEKLEGLIEKAGEIIEFLETADRGRDDPVQAAQALSMYLNLVGGIAGKVPGIGEFVSMYAKGVESMVQDLKTIQARQNLTGQTIRDINDFTADLTGETVPSETAASGPQRSDPPSKLDADAINRYNGTRAENDRLKQTTDDLKSTEKCIDRCQARIEALHRAIDDMRADRARQGTEKDLVARIDEMARNRDYFLKFRQQHGDNAVPNNNADYARFASGRDATDPRMVDARARLAKLRAIEPRIQKALDEIAQLQKRLEDCNKRLAGEQRAYLQSLRAFVEKDEYLRLLGAKVPVDQAQQQAKALADQIPSELPAPGTAVSSGGSCGTVSVVQVCEETSFSIPRHPGPPIATTATPKGETAADWAKRTQPPPIDFDKVNNVTEDPAQREREMRAIEQLGNR